MSEENPTMVNATAYLNERKKRKVLERRIEKMSTALRKIKFESSCSGSGESQKENWDQLEKINQIVCQVQ